MLLLSKYKSDLMGCLETNYIKRDTLTSYYAKTRLAQLIIQRNKLKNYGSIRNTNM